MREFFVYGCGYLLFVCLFVTALNTMREVKRVKREEFAPLTRETPQPVIAQVDVDVLVAVLHSSACKPILCMRLLLHSVQDVRYITFISQDGDHLPQHDVCALHELESFAEELVNDSLHGMSFFYTRNGLKMESLCIFASRASCHATLDVFARVCGIPDNDLQHRSRRA